jgi:hypothetical protein
MAGPQSHRPLEKPADIRDGTGARKDGRPTGKDDEGLRPGVDHDEAPTVAPEEQGQIPSTEHGPGADL